MHIYLAKSSRFESTDFVSDMIDDIGCSWRHQCPQCALSENKYKDTLSICLDKWKECITFTQILII